MTILEKLNKKPNSKENSKVVRIDELKETNNISFEENSPTSPFKPTTELVPQGFTSPSNAVGGQSKRQVYFLMEQLRSSKDELQAFRENHRALMSQLYTVKRDYQDKVDSVKKEKDYFADEYKRLMSSFKMKDEGFVSASRALKDIKIKYNQVQAVYAKKVADFKEQYRVKLEEKERENSKLIAESNHEKRQARGRVNELSQILSSKSEEIQALKAKIDEFDGINNMLSETSKKHIEQVEALTEMLSENKRKHDSLKRKLTEKELSIDPLTAQIENLKKDNQNFQFQIEKFLEDQEALTALRHEQAQRIKSLVEENKNLKAVKEDRSSLVDSINKFKAQEQRMLSEINSLKAKNGISAKELESSVRELQAYKRKIEELEDEKKGAAQLFEQVQIDLEKKISNLQDQKDKISSKATSLEKSLELFKANYDTEVKRRKEEKSLSDDISDKYSTLLEENKKSNLELIEEKSKNKLNTTKLVSAQTEVAELKRELFEKGEDLRDASAKIVEFENLKIQLHDDQIALETQIVQLTDELKSSRNEGFDNIDQISLLNAKLDGVEDEKNKILDSKKALESKILELKSEIEMHKAGQESLEQSLEKALEEHAVFKLKEAEFVEREEALKHEIDNLNVEIETIRKSLSGKEEELIKVFESNDAYIKQQKELMDEVYKLEKQKEALALDKQVVVQEKKREGDKLKEVISERETLVAKLEEKSLQMARVNEQVAIFNEKESRLYSDIDSLKKELKDTFKDKEALRKNLKMQISSLEEKGKDYESQIQKIKEEQLTLELSSKESDLEIKKFETIAQNEKERVEECLAKISSLKKERLETNEKLRLRIKDFNELNLSLEKNKSDMSSLKSDFEAAQKEVAKLTEQNHKLLNHIEDEKRLEKDIQHFEKSKKKFAGQIDERQKQLDLYSRWVDSQKEGLQKQVIRFAQEVKASSVLNPLKSYLKLTNKEINKIQKDLQVENLMAPHRKYMEKHLQQLTDQRDYMNDLILQSATDIESKIKEITGFLKQGDFIPVPPLPPQKK